MKKEFDWKNVPEETEELTEEENESIKRAKEDIKAGRVVNAEEVWEKAWNMIVEFS